MNSRQCQKNAPHERLHSEPEEAQPPRRPALLLPSLLSLKSLTSSPSPSPSLTLYCLFPSCPHSLFPDFFLYSSSFSPLDSLSHWGLYSLFQYQGNEAFDFGTQKCFIEPFSLPDVYNMKEVFYLSQWKVTEGKFPQCVSVGPGCFKPANSLCELDFQIHEQESPETILRTSQRTNPGDTEGTSRPPLLEDSVTTLATV